MNKSKIIIEYCPKCGWLLRAAWMAQELLTTFAEDLLEVALQPSLQSGIYVVYLNNNVIFDRKITGHFPESKELKQIVRNIIDPNRNLGHIDK